MISNPIIISALIHVFVILLALVGLPSMKSPEYDLPVSINVEMIDITEIAIKELQSKEKKIEKESTKKNAKIILSTKALLINIFTKSMII